jgi:chromate transporter
MSSRLAELARLFVRLGLTAFGGPVVHIAMMEEEVVRRRGWLDHPRFLDLLGATNLIPGPNSTEMAIHVGFLRAGWAGLVVAGLSFITPTVLIVLALAAAYVRYGWLPEVAAVLTGVKAVVIAIVAQAIWNLGRSAVKGPVTAAAGTIVCVASLAGGSEIALLLGAGLVVMAIEVARTDLVGRAFGGLLLPAAAVARSAAAAVHPASVPTLGALFAYFLKIGSVMFGSGYVLLAFLRGDVVVRFGWISEQQLLDAIAIGQLTPGPLSSSATFIGYLVGGTPGAIVATLGIFLPSFFFVAASAPFLPRLRRSRWASGFLAGVNVASLGLMAAVTLHLARAALGDLVSVAIAAASLGLLLGTGIGSVWLILGGGLVGVVKWIVIA